ncbi:hypothetical protein BC940DRAFT_290160 [Gongronella butleri]|nr:hypothetical protein BC940DRAFT_290160 [Gongronella butleri]
MSRLGGSYRPYYPWDRLSSSDTPSITSDPHHDSSAVSHGYKSSMTNSYHGSGNSSNDLLLDYRASGPSTVSSSSLSNDHVDTHSHAYPDFLGHRSNELSLYDPTSSSSPSGMTLSSHHRGERGNDPSTGLDGASSTSYSGPTTGFVADLSAGAGSGIGMKKTSAFQALDATIPAFHHPQPLYMDNAASNASTTGGHNHSGSSSPIMHRDVGSPLGQHLHAHRPASRSGFSSQQRHHPYANHQKPAAPYPRPFSPTLRDEVKTDVDFLSRPR